MSQVTVKPIEGAPPRELWLEIQYAYGNNIHFILQRPVTPEGEDDTSRFSRYLLTAMVTMENGMPMHLAPFVVKYTSLKEIIDNLQTIMQEGVQAQLDKMQADMIRRALETGAHMKMPPGADPGKLIH